MTEGIKGTVSFQCAGCGSDYSLTSDEINLSVLVSTIFQASGIVVLGTSVKGVINDIFRSTKIK
jgi:hypothetical protein